MNPYIPLKEATSWMVQIGPNPFLIPYQAPASFWPGWGGFRYPLVGGLDWWGFKPLVLVD